MKDFTREIEELRALIPTDFPCEPGCTDCCNRHVWTWAEWRRVPGEKQFNAVNMDAKCPYATAEGCHVYADRPLICRLYGNAGKIGRFKGFDSVTLECPRGIKPKTSLSPPQAREIFQKIMDIRNEEAQFRMRAGAIPVFAGPFGRYMVPR